MAIGLPANTRAGYTLSVSAGLIWASTGILVKYLLDHYGVAALAIAFWRDAFIALATQDQSVAIKVAFDFR